MPVAESVGCAGIVMNDPTHRFKATAEARGLREADRQGGHVMKRVIRKAVAQVRFFVAPMMGIVCLLAGALTSLGQVAFDVNPVVAARELGQIGIMSQMPNSRMVEVQLDVSALFTPGDSSRVTEYTVKMVSRHEDVQVADYSPRTELQSEILGPMQITQDSDRVREGAIRGVGGYPGLGRSRATRMVTTIRMRLSFMRGSPRWSCRQRRDIGSTTRGLLQGEAILAKHVGRSASISNCL